MKGNTPRQRLFSPDFLTGLRRQARPLPKMVLLVVAVQSFWWIFDRQVTSQIYHKPPKPYVKPTESSPLSPFYDEPYTGPARAFPPWSYSSSFPCGPLMSESQLADSRTATKEGLLFVKMPRVGSPTNNIPEDVTTRIARNAAKRWFPNFAKHSTNATSCSARIASQRARRWRDRIREKSFLWTLLKEPASRLVGMFYQQSVSLDEKEATAKNFCKYLGQNELAEAAYYFKSMTLRKSMNGFRNDLYGEYLKEILYGFDFIGTAERQEESLAVLQLLLGLETQDLLYLTQPLNDQQNSSSIQSTTYQLYSEQRHEKRKQDDKCIPMHEPKATLQMKEWFYSEEAEGVLEGDIMMYRAVNKSLDMTIEQLGREKVQKKVKLLKWALNWANEKCGQNVKYPCSDDGQVLTENDCLGGSVACGYQCLDKLGSELATDTKFQQLVATA